MIYYAIFIVYASLLVTKGYNVTDNVKPVISCTNPIQVELAAVSQALLVLPKTERGFLNATEGCLWTIDTTEQFTLRIDVGPFNISGTDNDCTEDYVRVGVNETTKEQDPKRCGENNAIRQEVKGQHMYFQLHTRNANTTKAFNVVVTRVPKSLKPIVSCDKKMPVDLTAVRQATIALPQSEGTLLGPKDCIWTMNTSTDYTLLLSYGPFDFDHSNVACDKDYVRVGPDESKKDGDAKRCEEQAVIDQKMDGQNMYFQLHIENGTKSKPFNVVAKRVLDEENPNLSCDRPFPVDLTDVDQVRLGLPETAGTLTGRKDCVWIIRTSDEFILQIEVGPFNISETDGNCTGDYVRVGMNETAMEQDPKHCGKNKEIKQKVDSQTMYFQLHTEDQSTTKSFNVTVQRVPRTIDPVVSCAGPIQVDLINISLAKLQLPTTKGMLTGNSNCIWTITTADQFNLRIKVGPFHISGTDRNCTGDYVRVGVNETAKDQDPKRCGENETIIQKVDGQKMYFQLHTENSTTTKPFNVVVKPDLVTVRGNSSTNSTDSL